jgi:hypothetical protein
VSLWLAAARAPARVESAPAHLQFVAAVVARLDGRFTFPGIEAAGVLDAHRRLRAILDTVDPAQLERTRQELAHVEQDLRQRAEVLARLLELKRRLTRS